MFVIVKQYVSIIEHAGVAVCWGSGVLERCISPFVDGVSAERSCPVCSSEQHTPGGGTRGLLPSAPLPPPPPDCRPAAGSGERDAVVHGAQCTCQMWPVCPLSKVTSAGRRQLDGSVAIVSGSFESVAEFAADDTFQRQQSRAMDTPSPRLFVALCLY